MAIACRIATADLTLMYIASGVFLLQSCWREKPTYGKSNPGGANLMLQETLERDPDATAAVQQGQWELNLPVFLPSFAQSPATLSQCLSSCSYGQSQARSVCSYCCCNGRGCSETGIVSANNAGKSKDCNVTAGRLTGKEQTRAGRRAEAAGRYPDDGASEVALN